MEAVAGVKSLWFDSSTHLHKKKIMDTNEHYIIDLERQNRELREENRTLKRREEEFLGNMVLIMGRWNIAARAGEVFSNRSKGWEWMVQSNSGLDGRTPWSILDTESGQDKVLQLLSKIEHGVHS